MKYIEIDLTDDKCVALLDNALRQMENDATTLQIQLSEDFIGYSYVVVFQLNDNTPIITAPLIPNSDNIVEVVIQNPLTYQSGFLKCELQAYENDILMKSAIFALQVVEAIQGEPEPMPTVYPPLYNYYDYSASDFGIVDLGNYFTSTTIEGALQEVGAELNGIVGSIPDVGSTYVVRDTDGTVNLDGVQLDLTPESPHGIGRLRWNETYGTAEIGLKGGVTTIQIGQETVLLGVNKTGVLIPNGAIVNVDGSVGNMPSLILADSNGIGQQRWVIGVATEDIGINATGYVTVVGIVNDVNTNTFNEGDILYLSTNAGQVTNVLPTPPNARIFIGWVLKKATNGIIFVRPSKEPIPAEIKIEDIGNYFTAIELESALQEVGSKIRGVYDDLPPCPLLTARTGATPPTLTTFKGNIPQYTFNVNTNESFGSTELTHQYKEGTDIMAHIHWASNGVDTTNRYVKWELEYSISRGADVFENVVVISSETMIPANAPITSYFITSLGTISGTGVKIGDYICWRLRRITSTGTAPTNNPFGIALGFHVEQDSFGSATVYSK